MGLSKESLARLQAESYYWLLVIAFLGVWIPFRMFIPMTLQVRHTYELPAAACVNRLTSDRWTWEFVREGLFVLYLLMPFSGVFMIWSRSRTGLWTHLVLLFTMFIWGFVMVGYDIESIGTANVSPLSPQYNPTNLATDKRWCLVYGGQPGTDIVCANSGPCTAAVGAVSFEDLHIDGPFTFRVAFNAIMLSFLAADFVFTLWTWRKLLSDWMVPDRKSENSPVESKVVIPKDRFNLPRRRQ